MDAQAVLDRTRADKKARAGAVEFALPTRLGAMADAGGRWAVPVDPALVRAVLDRRSAA
jgi:3-dehydroquinate synthetase